MALRAKLNLDGGCVKRFFSALRAKLYFERHLIFTISRSEIVKMRCLEKQYSAAAGGKNLFTQPQPFYIIQEAHAIIKVGKSESFANFRASTGKCGTDFVNSAALSLNKF